MAALYFNELVIIYFTMSTLLSPHNSSSIRKQAYSALYQGDLADAYHYSKLLDCVENKKIQSSRQRRIELYLGASYSKPTAKIIKGIITTSGEEKINPGNSSTHENLKKNFSWNSIHAPQLKFFPTSSKNEILHNTSASFYEPGASIKKKLFATDLPEKSIGYWFYKAIIAIESTHHEALVRIEEFPGNGAEFTFLLNEEIDSSKWQGKKAILYLLQKDEEHSNWLKCKLEMHSIFSRNSQQFGLENAFYQAHETWEIPGLRPTLERLEKYNLAQFIETSDSILDIGCNIGLFGGEVSKICKNYIGFDYNQDLIDIANLVKENKNLQNCTFLRSDCLDFLRNTQNKFDFIFSFAVHGWIGIEINDYIDLLKKISNEKARILIESHDLDFERNFEEKIMCFIKKGFKVLKQGTLKDDKLRERMFFVLQNN